MLNKNQSNKRNIWKYALILPVIIAFVFLFQIKVLAQEKNVTSVEAVAVSYVLDKNSTDAEIQEDIKMLKEQQGITYKVSNLKRNSKDEIIAIKIEFEDKKGNIGTTIQDNNKPITPIHFTANTDANGKGEIGFYELKPSKTENNFLAAVINKEESDSEISRKLQIFNEEGITFKKVKTKRNSDNEIISIQISGSGNGSVYNFNQTSDEPIDEIYLIKEYGKSSKLTISEKKDLKTAFAKNKTVTVEEVEIDEEVLLNDHFPTPPPTPPTPTTLIKETSYKAIETNQEKNRLYIINGKEYFQNELKGYTLKCDGAITYYEEDEAIKKFGEKAKDGVMVFSGVSVLEKINVSKEMQERKAIIFSNDNGDDIVFIPAEKSLKLPHYPSIRLNDDGLVLMVNGVQKSNPLETLNQMNLQNVKSVRVYDENGKETPGSQTKKIVITTK